MKSGVFCVPDDCYFGLPWSCTIDTQEQSSENCSFIRDLIMSPEMEVPAIEDLLDVELDVALEQPPSVTERYYKQIRFVSASCRSLWEIIVKEADSNIHLIFNVKQTTRGVNLMAIQLHVRVAPWPWCLARPGLPRLGWHRHIVARRLVSKCSLNSA